MTICIDMAYIWSRYGFDVNARQVASKLDIKYESISEHQNTNFTMLLKATNIPDILPSYISILSDYLSDDDIIHQLSF